MLINIETAMDKIEASEKKDLQVYLINGSKGIAKTFRIFNNFIEVDTKYLEDGIWITKAHRNVYLPLNYIIEIKDGNIIAIRKEKDKKITLEEVLKILPNEIQLKEPVYLTGGIVQRGYTHNDIDIVVSHTDLTEAKRIFNDIAPNINVWNDYDLNNTFYCIYNNGKKVFPVVKKEFKKSEIMERELLRIFGE